MWYSLAASVAGKQVLKVSECAVSDLGIDNTEEVNSARGRDGPIIPNLGLSAHVSLHTINKLCT